MKALIALATAAVLLAGCAALPVAPNSDLTSITFSQSQAVENFDDSQYTQRDKNQLAIFTSLLDQYGVVPGVTVTGGQDDCPGGITSTLRLSYGGGESASMVIPTCGLAQFDQFNQRANELVSEWRTALGGS